MRGTKATYIVGGPNSKGKFWAYNSVRREQVGPYCETEDEAEAKVESLNAEETDWTES